MEYSKGDNDAFVGRILDGRYRIVKRIGHGAYGAVYGAICITTNSKVVVKRLHDYSNRTTVDRFIQEASIYRQLLHPHIVHMQEMLIDSGMICIVMEYVRGQSMERFLQKDKVVFSIPQIIHIARQLADALEYAHRKGVIHRDLKAENIMLVPEPTTGDYDVKVLDFGLAKMMRRNTNFTTPGMVLGSPAYMSPEQCLGGKTDAGIDIYAFGIILYYLVCGRLPFEDDRTRILMRDQCKKPVPPMSRPDGSMIHPGLQRLILRCLEKKREDRYANFTEIRTALEFRPSNILSVLHAIIVFLLLWIIFILLMLYL